MLLIAELRIATAMLAEDFFAQTNDRGIWKFTHRASKVISVKVFLVHY